jgi:hypothetical protein
MNEALADGVGDSRKYDRDCPRFQVECGGRWGSVRENNVGLDATNMTRAARVAEAEAEDEVEAARAALAGLKANVARAEAELRHSQNMVVAHADRVLRGAAKGVMADAVDLTLRLRRARLTLHLLMRPEMGGRVIAAGRQPDVFGEAGDREAEQVRSDGFGGEVEAAIRRHLEFGLGSIHEAERQWSLAPELAPWIEARIALMDNPDAPLPSS